MVTPPLLDGTALAGFAGAPFAPAVVTAVAADVRAEAGWHIAPVISGATARVRPRGAALFLKTLQLTDVTEIRDVTDAATPVIEDLADWDWNPAGIVERQSWPYGRVYEVTFTHGYEACPPDLLPAIAALCSDARVDKAAGSVRLGSLSINGAGIDGVGSPGSMVARTIGRYRIPRSR